MVENHALTVVHLYEILLDLYDVMFGKEATDLKRTRELQMRYDILFVQDIDPQVHAQHIQYYYTTIFSS